MLKSRYAIALTGAGISAESGIPTFRGKNGLWKRYNVNKLATPEGFSTNPKLVWEWYNWRIGLVLNAKPNEGHKALAELEKLGVIKCIITQNVDDLHERAGAEKLLKLHGDILTSRCIRCGYRENVIKPYVEIPPKCPKCGSLLRPDVVWFNEPIPIEVLDKVYEETNKSDCILVVGTSGVVMPAGALPSMVKRNGGYVIEVNLEETHISWIADISIYDKAGHVLPKLVEKVREIMKKV